MIQAQGICVVRAISLPDEQHAQRALAAVAGDGAAGAALDDLLEGKALQQQGAHQRRLLGGDAGVGDEDALGVHGVGIAQPVVHILLQAPLIGAAELLAHHHLAAGDLDAGPQLQQVRAQHGHHGAAPALVQVVQPVDDEGGVHLVDEAVDVLEDSLRVALAALDEVHRLAEQERDAAGQVAAVHAIHRQPLRRPQGVLVAGGEVGAEVEVDDSVGVLEQFLELAPVGLRVHRRGLGQVAARVHMAEDVVRDDVRAVGVVPAAHGHGEGDDGDAVSADVVRGQVAGAVRRDANFHDCLQLFKGEEPHVLHAVDGAQLLRHVVHAAVQLAQVDGEHDAGLAVDGQALGDGEHVGVAGGHRAQHLGEHARPVVQLQHQRGLAAHGELAGLQDLVLVFVVGAAGDAHGVHRVDHLGAGAGFQQPPRLHHLDEVVRQRGLFHDQIFVQHGRSRPSKVFDYIILRGRASVKSGHGRIGVRPVRQRFVLVDLIRHGFAATPSPEGKAFGRLRGSTAFPFRGRWIDAKRQDG